MNEAEKIKLATKILKRNGYTKKEISEILLRVYGDRDNTDKVKKSE